MKTYAACCCRFYKFDKSHQTFREEFCRRCHRKLDYVPGEGTVMDEHRRIERLERIESIEEVNKKHSHPLCPPFFNNHFFGR